MILHWFVQLECSSVNVIVMRNGNDWKSTRKYNNPKRLAWWLRRYDPFLDFLVYIRASAQLSTPWSMLSIYLKSGSNFWSL